MKRITYISRATRVIDEHELAQIESVSVRNNSRDGISGALLYSGGVFFQIIEGQPADIDAVYSRILRDDRHTDILCLRTEEAIAARQFPDWSMKTINLDENSELLMQPIKMLLQTITDSHRILEKYTQPTILRILNAGQNPLTVAPRREHKLVFFSDIVSFSAFADLLAFDELDHVVSTYFEVCTRLISSHGGEVSKLIGDSVMAYFPADAADAALRASLKIQERLAAIRASAPQGSPLRALHTGIGLALGPVIEGNIGSSVKVDYTIIGDAVNLAARLEALTREVGRGIVFSSELSEHLREQWSLLSLGRRQLKGRSEALSVFTINDPITVMPPYAELAQEIRKQLGRVGAPSADTQRISG